MRNGELVSREVLERLEGAVTAFTAINELLKRGSKTARMYL
jgi:hypothetical protein